MLFPAILQEGRKHLIMKRKNVLALVAITGTIMLGGFFIDWHQNNVLQQRVEELEKANALLTEENFNLQGEIEMQRFIIKDNTEVYNENLANMYDLLATYMSGTSYEDNYGKLKYEEIILLAKTMQMEAGEQNYESQAAIASVILNRVNSQYFPDTIYDVIYERDDNAIQFAVAYNGAIDRCELKPETVIVACKVLSEGTQHPDNLLFFCADPVDFTSYATYYKTIEGTKFYTY
jgi:N-acetylmuramoyl-L-alanine amidase